MGLVKGIHQVGVGRQSELRIESRPSWKPSGIESQWVANRLAHRSTYLSGLLDRYLDQPGRKPATVRAYEVHIRLHILPLLGDVLVSTLHLRHIDQARNHLLQQGLTSSTVRSILAPLSGALTLAVTWGYLPASPMQGFKWPKLARREDAEFIWFDTTQMQVFMDASERHSPTL